MLPDRVVQVGGSDGQGDVQVFQPIPVGGGLRAGGLGGWLPGQRPGYRGRVGEQAGDLLGVDGVERDAPGTRPVAR